MAKISELVKTYKLLSDPNAPDWNVKFIGGLVVALTLIVAAVAVLLSATGNLEPEAAAAPAAASMPAAQQPAPAEVAAPPGDLSSCDAAEVAQELERLGVDTLPRGHILPSGCTIG